MYPIASSSRASALYDEESSVEVKDDVVERDSKLTSDEELASSEDGSDWNDDFIRSASSELPPDIDPDERLINSSKYFEELEELANDVFLHSAFRTVGRLRSDPLRLSDLVINFPYPKDLPKPEITDVQALGAFDQYFAKLNEGASSDTPIRTYFRTFLTLLECRNVISNVSEQMSRLSRARFCTSWISFLTLESDRDVVSLVRISISEIGLLEDTFNNALKTRFEHVQELIYRKTLGFDTLEIFEGHLNEENTLTQQCTSYLKEKLCLNSIESRNDTDVWRCLVYTLDLAVLSYVGAHVGKFDVRSHNTYLTIACFPHLYES